MIRFLHFSLFTFHFIAYSRVSVIQSMISYLSGRVMQKCNKALTLLVGGVGYSVKTGNGLLSEVGMDQEIGLHIHTHVREDDLSLFGFLSVEDLRFFLQLTSVSGIGPKVAMTILDTPVDQVKISIVSEDVGYLSKIPGLGKKTAERLILELKNKVEMVDVNVDHRSSRSINADAVDALCGLGYDRNMVVRFLSEVPEEIKETEEMVRYFLQNA
jgi:holliday junction DNA helicase RuvA